MQTLNTFTAGLQTDIALTDVRQNFFIKGHNVRLSRNNEGTLWATNIKSNKKTFELPEGNIPLGSVEFDGYLFIASVNSDTGVSEIGVFPTPATVPIRSYSPLNVYSPTDIALTLENDCTLPDFNQLSPLKTKALGFDCRFPIRMKARLDFDGSVNLYFTDNLNPWRVINSGFVLKTREPNSRYVTENQIINGTINGINESEKHPIVNANDVQSGGSLLVGNYYFFVRYTDLNFTTTSFLGQTRAIPVFNTNRPATFDIPFGGEEIEATDKLVELNISNLDVTNAFFEIGYIRYYGDNIFETFLVDKRYPINGSATANVEITGSESLLAITLDELVTYKPSDALYCKDLDQGSNQLYLANTRGPQLDHPDLRRFMCALTLSEENENIGHADETRLQNATVYENQYNADANDTEDRLGYFRGETYIFAAIPVFTGGFIGQPFPVTGFDNFNGLMSNQNKQGIYRFNKAQNNPFFLNGDVFANKIVVNTAAAQTIYNTSQFLKDNLIGIYIARGERNRNLLYQGLSLRCYNGKINPELQKFGREFNKGVGNPAQPIIFQSNEERWETENVMPLFEPAMYSLMVNRESTNITPGATDYIGYYMYAPPFEKEDRNDFTDLNKLGIFSPDYFVDDIDIPSNVHIELVGTTSYGVDWRRESGSINPVPVNETNALMSYLGGFTNTEPVLDATRNSFIIAPLQGNARTFYGYNLQNINYANDSFQSSALNITGYQNIPNQGFVSRFEEGKIGQPDSGFYYYQRNVVVTNTAEYDISLPIAVPKYMGILNAPTYLPAGTSGNFNHYVDKWDRAVVNVYRNDPNVVNYQNFYDFKNTSFAFISDFEEITSFLAAGTKKYYGGDCVINRTYLKIANGSIENLGVGFTNIITGTDMPGGVAGLDGNFDEMTEDLESGYGHWISLVTENANNINYRHELGRNKFYPKTSVTNPGTDFCWIYDSPESDFYNRGYSKFLSPRRLVGADLLQPVSNNNFPTRIRPSITHIFGAVRDGYRQFIPADAKDFDYQYGEINAILFYRDSLYSFQSRAINLHPISERITQQGTSGSPATLGESVGLTQYKRLLIENYGTQHRFSVIKADSGIYCVDWNKRCILIIQGGNTKILSDLKQVSTRIDRIVDTISSGFSDASDQLPDQHPCSLGILSGYNRNEGEIVWTFRLGEENITFAYDEEFGAFLDTHGYHPIHYALLENDFYEFPNHTAWKHGAGDDYDVFFGQQDEWKIRIVVNANPETTKVFDYLVINSNNQEFAKIEYETQHQRAVQDPFINTVEFWYEPTYRVNQWRLPIRRQDNTVEPNLNIYDDFTNGSGEMRGRYLIIELTFNKNTPLWVRDIITFFNKSYV